MPSEIVVMDGLVTTRGLPGQCPACNHKLDSATSADGRSTPVPGDISLCINCGEILEFDDNLKVILITDECRKDIPPEEWNEIRTMQLAIRSLPKDR